LRQPNDGFGGEQWFSQNPLRCNADNSPPVCLEQYVSSYIALRPIAHVVRDSIDLDQQASFEAGEVRDIALDRILIAEFDAERPAA
jgi:hypothetical protein